MSRLWTFVRASLFTIFLAIQPGWWECKSICKTRAHSFLSVITVTLLKMQVFAQVSTIASTQLLNYLSGGMEFRRAG